MGRKSCSVVFLHPQNCPARLSPLHAHYCLTAKRGGWGSQGMEGTKEDWVSLASKQCRLCQNKHFTLHVPVECTKCSHLSISPLSANFKTEEEQIHRGVHSLMSFFASLTLCLLFRSSCVTDEVMRAQHSTGFTRKHPPTTHAAIASITTSSTTHRLWTKISTFYWCCFYYYYYFYYYAQVV